MNDRKQVQQTSPITELIKSIPLFSLKEGCFHVRIGFCLAFLIGFGTATLQRGISNLIQELVPLSELPSSVYLKAKDAYIRNDLSETIQLLEPAAKEPGRNPAAAFLLGKAYFFRSNFPEAERIWKGLLGQVPHHSEAQKWLVRLYLNQGKVEEAAQICVRLLALDSENPEGLFLLGKARLSKGDTRAALECLEKGKASLRKLAEIPLELADLYRQFGIKKRCKEELELALHLLGKESALSHTVEESLKILGEP